MANIFLSYRRDGGEALAEILYTKLTERGYDVFYDKESLKAGLFEPKLYTEIERCDDFVLILPPHGLDRCLESEEDWVRCEIRHAVACGKNIIPVIMRGFSFPPNMPEDIRDVSRSNGVPFENMEFIDARVDRITELMICQPLSPRKRRASRKSTSKDPAAPRKRRGASAIGKGAGFLWSHVLTHIVIAIWLLWLVVYFGNETLRYCLNSNVDQWVVPQYLAVGSPLLTNTSVSADNTLFAKPNGDGVVTIWEILPSGEDTPVMDCHTELGDEKILAFFDKGNRMVAVMTDQRMELYNIHTGSMLCGYNFHGEESWSVYAGGVLVEKETNPQAWVLWAEEDPESPTNSSLRAFCLYDYDGTYFVETQISLDGLSFIGIDEKEQYLLFVDENQEPYIFDIRDVSFVPSDQTSTVMTNSLCGHMEKHNERVDPTGRYFVYCVYKTGKYEGYCDIMIYDMQIGEYIRTATYPYLCHFSFSTEGHYLILAGKVDPKRDVWVPELKSVCYVDPSVPDEVILHEKQINKLFVTNDLFSEPYFDVMQFENSNTLLVILNNRLQIIDLTRKRRTASSNGFLKKEHVDTIRTAYGAEQNGCVYVSLLSEVEDAESGETLQGLTLGRFFFTEDRGRITVKEDAYEGKLSGLLPSVLILALSLGGLIAFEVYGIRHCRRKKDSRAQTALTPEIQNLEKTES